FAGGAKETDDIEQIQMRTDRVAVANEVLDRRDPEHGASQHEKGTVEAAPVEGDEAMKARDRLPELDEEDRLDVADEREKSVGGGLLEPAARLFVPDAPAATLGIDHREDDDSPGERPKRQQFGKLGALLLGAAILLQVGALRVVERLPLHAHGFDVEDDAGHGRSRCYPLGRIFGSRPEPRWSVEPP